MNFTYDRSGTPQQVAWAQEALTRCGYDLSLFAFDVLVKWVDPLPVSSDIGHAHSYMVTQSSAGTGYDYTIFIASWADDASNRNNSGLPNPGADIQEFYMQSFVHELGHIVIWNTILVHNDEPYVAGLYWTPDTAGGSGRRYGTLADWSVSTWAQNMNEAVAETFKCVYYQGRLIYLNRTIWHLDPTSWNDLWFKLLPPQKTIWKDTGIGAQVKATGNGSAQSPDNLPVSYLDGAHAQMIYGPVIQPLPWPIPNEGGIYNLFLEVVSVDEVTFAQRTVAHIGISGAMDMSPSGQPPYSWAEATVIIGGIVYDANVQVGNPGSFEPLDIYLNGTGVPGEVAVKAIVFGGLEADGVTSVSANQHLLLVANAQIPSGDDFEINVSKVSWLADYKASPPPFPFGDSSGSMLVGSGLRGAILIGDN